MSAHELDPPSNRDASLERGRRAADAVPVESLGRFDPPGNRDPIGLLRAQDDGRVVDLVPVRHERMSESAFTFFRGAAAPMAADLAAGTSPDLWVQLCGDAHVSNFGAYASPERRLVFDLNDFDETLPGPFDWDLKRLAASLAVAGRDNEYDLTKRHEIVRHTVQAYREAMAQFADTAAAGVFYARLDVVDELKSIKDKLTSKERKRAKSGVTKAHSRDGLQALDKLTVMEDGERRLRSDPPLLVPIEDLTDDPEATYAFVEDVMAHYVSTLAPDRRQLIGRFSVARVARKVVGVGSVGTRSWVVLMRPHDDMDPLLLQMKQANRSVLSDHLGESEYDNQGERVVAGQRMIQAASDVLLGWQRADHPVEGVHDYYVRQLRDWKYSVDLSALKPAAMKRYGALCGWTLARAHARTGDRIAIASYLGESDAIETAMADFAEAYADQTEADHAAHLAAISRGDVPVADEIGAGG